MEFKIRLVQLKSGLYQVQQGQVEYDDIPCRGSYVRNWEVLTETSNKPYALASYESEKTKNLTGVSKVLEEFSFNKE